MSKLSQKKSPSSSVKSVHSRKLTPAKVDRIYGIPAKKLHYLAATDQIPYYRLGQRILLFDEADIIALLESSRREPA